MTDAPTTPDPIEIAMEAEASGVAPKGVAHGLLVDQRRLVRWQIASERAGFALKLVTGAAALVAAAVLAALAWQASQDRGLVIDAFSVPPALAADGLTGEVVATRLLDRLQAMQLATGSERRPDTFQNDWSRSIAVEVPGAGVSLDEVERLLRRRLGHASHLTGEVFRAPLPGGQMGIALTARLGAEAPQTFAGPQADLDRLVGQAAEAIFRARQPYRYAQFLAQHGRTDEAFAVISKLARAGPRPERAWANGLWGFFELDLRGDARAADRRFAVARRMGHISGYGYAQNATIWLGHIERELAYSRMERRLLRDPATRRQVTPDFIANQERALPAQEAFFVGDYPTAAARFAQAEQTGDFLGSNSAFPAWRVTALALAHDPGAAEAALADLDPNDDPALLPAIVQYAALALPNYFIAAERGRWDLALAHARASDAALTGMVAARPVMALPLATWVRPLEALALARTGDLAGAEALAAVTPLDCYLCVRIRGTLAAMRGDASASNRWFAEAVRQAPSIPLAHQDWAEAMLARGDLAGALRMAREAQRRSPRFADPIKLEGDILMTQGDSAGAATRYAAAAKLTPRWGALRLRWSQSLERMGKTEEAKAQRRLAAGLDLPPAERTELTRVNR